MIRRDIKLREEHQKIYNSRTLVVGLISPFGIMFLIFLVFSLASDTTSEQPSLANGQTQALQAQRGIEGR
jgi:hypothetical protein